MPVEYQLLGIVSDKDHFYAIGFSQKNEVIFETFTTTGNSLSKISLPLPFNVLSEEIRFDEIFYTYESDIYWCCQDNDNCYFLSYNVETSEWTNTWIIEKRHRHSCLWM